MHSITCRIPESQYPRLVRSSVGGWFDCFQLGALTNHTARVLSVLGEPTFCPASRPSWLLVFPAWALSLPPSCSPCCRCPTAPCTSRLPQPPVQGPHLRLIRSCMHTYTHSCLCQQLLQADRWCRRGMGSLGEDSHPLLANEDIHLGRKRTR